MEEYTNLFGIPVPSSNKVFLTFIVTHILIALVAVISGLLAILSNKTSEQHKVYGRIYSLSMFSSFITIIILSVMRWSHNTHLLIIGFFAAIFTLVGYRLSKGKRNSWTRLHTVCMGLSYILLLTGFYVDNGKYLPFWKHFPHWFFWIFPVTVGIPIILFALKKHPLNRRTL